MKARIPNQGVNSQANMMKKIQDMQNEMARVQQEVEESEFEACSGGGAVEVKVNGKHEILSVNIKPEVVDPDDKEMLEDLITAAVNDCLNQIAKAEKEKLPQMPAGM